MARTYHIVPGFNSQETFLIRAIAKAEARITERLKKFWASIDKSPRPKGCWLWTAGLQGGYGRISASGKGTFRAHRLMWELHNGPIPKNMMICHHCDEPRCVRLSHLYIGSAADNSRDAVLRGLTPTGDRNGSRKHPSKMPKGSKHWKAILNEDKVKAIRKEYMESRITYEQLALKYKVSKGTIHHIIQRLSWKHLP